MNTVLPRWRAPSDLASAFVVHRRTGLAGEAAFFREHTPEPLLGTEPPDGALSGHPGLKLEGHAGQSAWLERRRRSNYGVGR